MESDPHTYQPSPKDSILLARADLIVINGLDFEKEIEKMIASSGFKGKLCKATDNIPYRKNPLDPHLWHDVKYAKIYVDNITIFLCAYDPKNKNLYQDNKQKFVQELDNLDQWIHQQFLTIPPDKRLVVTTHDAFWYFGKAYGIEFLSPVGISTDVEPSAKKIAGLITFIKKKKIKAVFVENLANQKLINQIIQETGLTLQGTLYADSLSNSQGSASTYENMMRHNTTIISQSLQKALS